MVSMLITRLVTRVITRHAAGVYTRLVTMISINLCGRTWFILDPAMACHHVDCLSHLLHDESIRINISEKCPLQKCKHQQTRN